MSTQGASTSSPSTSSTPRWTYDVFLSFRGEDTRKGFTDHLYKALKDKDILTFRDDEKIERGKPIPRELEKAIEESRFAFVIFSKNYAFSPWCMDELEYIDRCRREKGLEVWPIFYHVDPSDVEEQRGTFGKAFDEYKESFKESIEKVGKWKSTLTEVAKLAGWDLKDRHESEFIQEIVEEMIKKLDLKPLIINENLVGIESIVAELIPRYLDFGNNVCMVGICGMGGIGKTTLARVVYDRHSNKFEASSFIAVGRENSKLEELREKILGDLGVTKNWLRRKKVLLVLDDVNSVKELETLAGEDYWYGSGSWIIITTRNENVLVAHGVRKIYKPNGLNDDDALKLFDLKAFKNEQPREDYMPLSQEVVKYANGLPLALVTLGSFLAGKTRDEWQSALNYIEKIPPKDIFDVLKISFDGLENMCKEVFLDIACFFRRWRKDDVIHILDNCGFEAKICIRDLVDKSLLTLTYEFGYEILGMHDLLKEMGQTIVHQQSCGERGKQSRLWLFNDLFDVLENNTATNAIQAIVIHHCQPRFRKIYYGEEFEEFPEGFSKMSNLRLVIIDRLYFPSALNCVPNSLRHLSWKYCPLKCLPSSFQPKELVELNLEYSKCEYLWEGAKCLENLKFINLSSSKLIRTPDFSGAPRLEVLDLRSCYRLVGLHPSIGQLSKLKSLDLSSCKSLTNLPSLSAKMKSLTSIGLFGCSKIKKIPEFEGTMKSLSRLILGWTAIKELPPSSIECLTALEILDLSLCFKLLSVSELPSTMRYINMQSCWSLEPSPALHRQSSLSRPCSSPFFRQYDESSGGVAFTILNRYVQGVFCQKIGYETATKRKEDGSKTEFQIMIPGCSVPRWLTHQSSGNSISVVLSPNWCNSRWMGFTLCALFNKYSYSSLRARVKAIGDMPHCQYVSKFHFGFCLEDHVWLLYLSRDDWFCTVGNGECSQIEVVFENNPDSMYHGFPNPVCRCGVSLVYERDMEPMEELNQANAQCSSSSRVITFEGWDGVHRGFVKSKRSVTTSKRRKKRKRLAVMTVMTKYLFNVKKMKYFPLHPMLRTKLKKKETVE